MGNAGNVRDKLCRNALLASATFLAPAMPAAAQTATSAPEQERQDTRAAPTPEGNSAAGAVSSSNLDIVISGRRASVSSGLISRLDVAKSASLVTEAFIKDQPAGSNPFQLLNLAPGINANNRGSTGLDRGQISIRGFQSNQLGLSLDGIPINDSGTFNTFPQEYVDTENLSQIFVLQGAGDAETPNIGATGGVIGMTVRKPAAELGVSAIQAFGEDGYTRSYARIDTGAFGDGNRAFLSFSHGVVEPWRGIGKTSRDHIDAMLQHETDGGSVFSVAAYYNRQMMAQYQALTKAQVRQFGYFANYATVFNAVAPAQAGTVQNDDDSAIVGGQFQRANYSALNYNPFQNLVLSTKASLKLTDDLHLDVQPYLWYGQGNGGVGSYLSEKNVALLGAARDVNGDGDAIDNRLFYNPYLQKQYRPGVISRLKWTVASQEIILGFHFERANLREWRSFVGVNGASGVPLDYWSRAASETLTRADGSLIRNQDQRTITTTIRPFVQDVIHLADDAVTVTLGLQLPIVKRQGDNYLPLALRTSNGRIAPTTVDTEQKRLLPNAGIIWKVTSRHSLFASIAKTFRATDNAPLFQPGASFAALKPETAVDAEAGYRYAGPVVVGSLSLYHIDYRDRQQSLFDVTVGNTVARNIGNVKLKGIEAEIGTQPIGFVSFYLSGSLNDTRLQNDVPVGNNGQTTNALLPTSGKQLTDVPRTTAAGQIRYDDGTLFGQVQAKYTGRRYSTLVNDDYVSPLTTVDLMAGYNLPSAWTRGVRTSLTVNVSNVFDKRYFGAINFGRNLNATNGIAPNPASFFLGAPRFLSVKLRADF
jgi:iron complex outermembrane receptor protein